jgi:tRNA (cmo5U34)-methyltransferase
MSMMSCLKMSEPDDLFDRPTTPVKPFEFDADVARVFPDMVRRSVPGYAELVGLTGLIARRVVKPGTRCYDLGCSLGAVTRELLLQTPPDVTVVGVDASEAMIDGIRTRLAGVPGVERLVTVQGDLETVEITEAALVVLNLTLQFVPPERRDPLMARIRAGLVPGGMVVLAEKVEVPDSQGGHLLRTLHEDFKRANGYSELAISRKRAALERVLIPETIEIHERRFVEAGFVGHTRWFQNLNFVAWVAWI